MQPSYHFANNQEQFEEAHIMAGGTGGISLQECYKTNFQSKLGDVFEILATLGICFMINYTVCKEYSNAICDKRLNYLQEMRTFRNIWNNLSTVKA